MPDKKLHDLEGLPTLAADDEIYVNDASDTTDSVDGTSKKFSIGVTSPLVGTTDTQTLTNKTLTSPVIATISNTGVVTLPTATDTLVGRNTTDTLTLKTLTTPVIASIYQDAAKTKLITLPNTASDTLVTLAATQTLTTETLTTPVVASLYQDAAKTKLMTVPDTASDTLAAIAATQVLTNKHVQLKGQRGFLLNGKISPSVTSTNLTVAIKGIDGNDPSATNPVYCRIGDSIRTISAALSITCNAATNWFNSGSTEHAAQLIEYFVYLGYNATDGVVVGFARVPYGNEYSSFSTTSTAENYCAISTITNAASGDDYEVVGRFEATLSAGAGYTWTVPTYTNINLIQFPVYETSYLTWLPTYTGFSANPTHTCRYRIHRRRMDVLMSGTAAGTSNATTFTITLPFTPLSLTGSVSWHIPAMAVDNGAIVAAWGKIRIQDATATAGLFTNAATGAWTNSGTKYADFEGWYEI